MLGPLGILAEVILWVGSSFGACYGLLCRCSSGCQGFPVVSSLCRVGIMSVALLGPPVVVTAVAGFFPGILGHDETFFMDWGFCLCLASEDRVLVYRS